MTKKISVKKVIRKRHSQSFKDEMLLLSSTVGVSEAALQLGPHESQIYDWRRKQQRESETSQVEVDQAAEIARLKRLVAEQSEELAIVKKAASFNISRSSVTRRS
jgi:transposase